MHQDMPILVSSHTQSFCITLWPSFPSTLHLWEIQKFLKKKHYPQVIMPKAVIHPNSHAKQGWAWSVHFWAPGNSCLSSTFTGVFSYWLHSFFWLFHLKRDRRRKKGREREKERSGSSSLLWSSSSNLFLFFALHTLQ